MASAVTTERTGTSGSDEPTRRRSLPAALIAAIRPRQCLTKNLLVFCALVFAREKRRRRAENARRYARA